MIEIVVIKLVLAGIVLFAVLNLAGFHTWVERKQSALIQDRIGANRASIYGWTFMGLFHPLADSIKMFMKEDVVPAQVDKVLHTLAPFFSVFFALVAFAAIPFGDRIIVGDRVIELQIAKIDVALLYIFAMLSLGVYGVILAGFASRNNYALLGGLRATAQMISYEIALGIAIIGVVMIYGTGESRTSPPGIDGMITYETLRKPVLPVSVIIGGQRAEVLYAGSAPGLVAGVLQVNARVPTSWSPVW